MDWGFAAWPFYFAQLFFTTQFLVCCSRAIVSQLGAQHGPTWPQLGPRNHLTMVLRAIPKAINRHVVSTHQFLGENWPPGIPLDPRKFEFRMGRVHIFTISTLCLLDGSWVPTWPHFGTILGAKLGHVGHQVGLRLQF